MMPRRVWERALWGIAGLGGAAAIIGTRMAIQAPAVPAPVIWSAPNGAIARGADSLGVLALTIVRADPFRLDRAPTTVAYQAGAGSEPTAPPSAPPKPSLALAGLIGGPPWAAILEGVPGRAGSVIAHTDDVFGALRIRHIDHHGAVITGMDTTWILTLQHPWH